MTKKEDSPPVFEEIKKEVDPIVDDALKWLEENDKATTEEYKTKQKELEGKINPLMQKLYGGIQPPTGDGDGVGDVDDKKTGEPHIDEVD